jgi:hypothetical protein
MGGAQGSLNGKEIRMRLRMTVAALTVGLALAGLLAATGVAATVYRTHIAITNVAYTAGNNETHFYGYLSSPKPACMQDRIVKLFKVTQTGRILKARTHSTAEGDYDAHFKGNLPVGDYFTKATRDPHKRFVCHSDRSKIYTIGAG